MIERSINTTASYKVFKADTVDLQWYERYVNVQISCLDVHTILVNGNRDDYGSMSLAIFGVELSRGWILNFARIMNFSSKAQVAIL